MAASRQALRKGEGEGKESLVATVCACADFSAILWNLDTCLYMSATLGQSILVALLLLVFCSVACSVVLFALEKLGVCVKWIQLGQFLTERIHSCAFPWAMARVYVIRLFLSSRISSLVVHAIVLTILYDSLHYKNVL